MGNLINPIASRLNLVNFWPATWPVAFASLEQPRFAQLWLHLKLVLRMALHRIFAQNPWHRRHTTALYGLLQGLTAAVWGFGRDRLSLYLVLYDYQAAVALLRFAANRYSPLKDLLVAVRGFVGGRSLSSTRPAPYNGLLKRRVVRFLFRRLVAGQRSSGRPQRGVFFSRAVGRFARWVLRDTRRLLSRRLSAWHLSLASHLKPYLVASCRAYGFVQCLVFSRFVRGTVTAGMASRFMVLKLQQGFPLAFVVRTVKRSLRRFFTQASGYKLCLAGRFTRKQIATYTWFKTGSIALNQRASGIDYAQDFGFSRFGMFGVKLWVFGHLNQT